MGLMSISTENPYFTTMMITILGFVLRSSPQLLVMRFDNQEESFKDQILLLEIFEGSVLFSQILIVLIFIGIVVSQYVILKHFRGLIVGQILIKLFFPFQVYLAVSLYNKRSSGVENIVFLVLMILSAIIVQTITTFFEYRFHSNQYKKNLSIYKLYEIIWELNLLLPAFGSLFINNHSQLVILFIILILLNIFKTTVFSCQIVYQTPVLEYCGYIGQYTSWMTIVELALFIFFNINPFTLQWINLIIIIFLIFAPFKQIIAIMEVKYMKQFKKQEFIENSIQSSILGLSSNNSSEKSMYTLMKKISTVVFIQGELQMAKNTKMDNSKILEQERPFFIFSQNFMHEIKKSKYMNGQKQNIFLDNQENQQQYLNIWYYIQNNPILLTKRFYNFQRFLIYCLPIQNNLSHLRLVQLFYSWFNELEDETFTSTQHSDSFRETIHRRLDYMFLRQRIDNQFTFQKRLIQNGIDTKRQIMGDKETKMFCLSLKEDKYFNWKFEESFDQSEFQQRIHNQMSAFIETEQQLIDLLTCSEMKKKFQIFSHLIERSGKKNRIYSIFDEYNISRRSIKCTIYEYMITKFILKLPRLATRQLRERMEIITRDSVQLLDEDKTKFTVIISGMRQKGYIIHTCSMFKQKMEIKQLRDQYKESKRIHINDLMMQFYSEKHLQALEGLNYMSESMRKYHNTRRKGLFMASLVTQRLYQVSFTINFMTRSMHDIYLVMDMTYKEVGSLTVFKNGVRVFQKRSPIVIIKSQPSISTCSRSSFQHREKSKLIKATEQIFDEEYQFEFQYIDSQQIDEDAERKSSNEKYIEEQQFEARLLETKQKDLQSYRNQTYFNQQYWTSFTILMFLIPVLLTLLTYILASLAGQNQEENKNFYLTNYNVQNQFFLTDLKSFNIFFVFNIFNAPYILFQNIKQKVAFFDSWRFSLTEELNNINSRGVKVVQDTLRPNIITPFLFAPLSENQTSFLYRKQRYDAQFMDILNSFGNISTTQQFQNTGSISNIIPNQGQFYQLQRFYKYNIHVFKRYTQPISGVFPQLHKVSSDSLQGQKTLFSQVSLGIILLWVFGGIGFVLTFLKLKQRVLELVSHCFSFNESNFRLMILRLAQFKQLLKTSERSSSCTLVNKIGLVSNKKVSDDSRVLSNTSFKRIDTQRPKMNVLKHSWQQIVIFLLIVFGFSMIIYSFNNDSISQIHLMERYLSGTHQLVDVTGKTLYLFNCLMDSLLSPSPIDPLIPKYIDEILNVDRVAILRKLFPSQQVLHKITFDPICFQYEDMNCYADQYSRQNYMQTMGRIIHLSSGLYNAMLRTGKYGDINEEPILQLYNQVNLMTKMIRRILFEVEKNFISDYTNMMIYIYYVCAYLVFYCVVIAWWTWKQTYLKNKIYYQQVLSLVSYQEMIRISHFHFYLHDIENQQWVENHDHF